MALKFHVWWTMLRRNNKNCVNANGVDRIFWEKSYDEDGYREKIAIE